MAKSKNNFNVLVNGEFHEKLPIEVGTDIDAVLDRLKRPAAPVVDTSELATADFSGLLDADNLAILQPSWVFKHVPKASQLSSAQPKWIIEEMLFEHGLHIFSGMQGSMKSMLALMLSEAVASGKEFMRRKNIGRKISVVYVDKENPESEVRRRCAALGLLKLDNFFVWGDWQPDNPPPLTFDDPRLLECARREKDVFFVFDSLSSFLNGADENDSGPMMQIMGQARLLARACAGVIILHHQSKAKGSKGSRGSTAIPASSDMAFIVEKNGNFVTLTEERFRMCQGYRMEYEMSFGIPNYTYIIINNGLRGENAVKPDTNFQESPEEKAERERECKTRQAELDLKKAGMIQAAGRRIKECYDRGTPVMSRKQLMEMMGWNRREADDVLTAGEDKPWNCVPGSRGGTAYIPKGANWPIDKKALFIT